MLLSSIYIGASLTRSILGFKKKKKFKSPINKFISYRNSSIIVNNY